MTKRKKITLSIPVFVAVYVAVIAVCVGLDQLTKYLIGNAIGYHGQKTIPVLGNWLVFYGTLNDAAMGGFFSKLEWRNWLFFVMTLAGIPVFGWLLWRSRTRSAWGQVAYSFIIGGTIGNAIDRIAFAEDGFFTGSVRDFVKVDGFFGIFNVADSFLVVGVILAVLAIVFFDPDSLVASIKEERAQKLAQAEGTNLPNASVNAETNDGVAVALDQADEAGVSDGENNVASTPNADDSILATDTVDDEHTNTDEQ